jgi:hypothetical protein
MRLNRSRRKTSCVREDIVTKRKSRFTRFLEAHKKPLTLISAVIVFLSFTFKEAVGERAKEKLQEVKDAETEYNNDITSRFRNDRSFERVEEKLTLLTEVLVEGHKKTHDDEELARAEKLENRESSDFYLVYHRIETLAEHSDRKAYYLAAIEKLSQEVDLAIRETDKADPTQEEKLKSISDSTEMWRGEYKKIKLIERELWNETTTRHHRLERTLKVTSWGTYILFVFGWVLGLVLSMEGVGTPKAE